MDKTRTRFAPSPTGLMHIGGLRTALYAYALAKRSGGDFILRIEDTDRKREVSGSKEKIKELLNLFGLAWDEYYVQSERLNKYQDAAEKLVKEGYAFYCQCQPKNASRQGYSEILRDPCREKKLTSGAIKLKVPDDEKISFTDFVLEKEISWDTSTVADTTLLKSDGFPTYHLAVVVDDTDMKISHVLRGHDWMPSTPIHLLVYKFLNYKVPLIGHLTDILDPEGGKLSKRKGSTSCEGLLSEGYLPEAILNFVMLLGWAPKDNREIFSLAEFVKVFDKNGLQKSNPIFNREKLDWFNGEYIRQKDDAELALLLKPFAKDFSDVQIRKIVPLIKNRIKKLSDCQSYVDYVLKKSEDIEPKIITDKYVSHISNATTAVKQVEPKDWNSPIVTDKFKEVIEKNKFNTGEFYMDIRGTISGSSITPPINETIVMIDQKDVIKRFEKGLEKAKNK